MEVLNISECEITHRGAVSIYLGIKKPATIRKLVIDGNKLTAQLNPELT